VTASLRVNRRGFTPGQAIVCDASVFNGTDSSIRATKIKLYKVLHLGVHCLNAYNIIVVKNGKVVCFLFYQAVDNIKTRLML